MEEKDLYTSSDVEAFANKLHQWAQELTQQERAFLNILFNDAVRCPPEPCPKLQIEDRIDSLAASALKSVAGYEKPKEEDGVIFWRRTAGAT